MFEPQKAQKIFVKKGSLHFGTDQFFKKN